MEDAVYLAGGNTFPPDSNCPTNYVKLLEDASELNCAMALQDPKLAFGSTITLEIAKRAVEILLPAHLTPAMLSAVDDQYFEENVKRSMGVGYSVDRVNKHKAAQNTEEALSDLEFWTAAGKWLEESLMRMKQKACDSIQSQCYVWDLTKTMNKLVDLIQEQKDKDETSGTSLAPSPDGEYFEKPFPLKTHSSQSSQTSSPSSSPLLWPLSSA